MTLDHQPVLCEETIDLVIAQGLEEAAEVTQVYVDATYGRGGHSRALLAHLHAPDRLVAIDRDTAAVAAGQTHANSDPRLLVCHGRFSQLRRILDDLSITRVSGVIMDLGVSSPQLDTADRGFSFRTDGPIDMRMDRTAGQTAAEWLNSATEKDIAHVLKTLGEERYARRIARAIVDVRPLTSTLELAGLVSRAQPRPRSGGKHDATRVFQALRMHVNDEMGELESGLEVAFKCLVPGGRLAIITFHSLEDRAVKRGFRRLVTGVPLPRRLPVRAVDAPPSAKIIGGPIRASEREVAVNPRARSATLRVLERLV